MTPSLWQWLSTCIILVTYYSPLISSLNCTFSSCRYQQPTTFLNCSSSNCSHVEFNNLTKMVTKLSLRNNQLTEVTSRMAFRAGILDIDLSLNNISAFENDAFFQGCNLTTVNLTRNSMTMDALTRDLFMFCQRMENLYLASNRLGKLTNDAFFSFSLKMLNLSDNGIVEVEDNALTDLNILSLDLSVNLITNLSVKHFLGLRKLQFLSLSKNRLKTLPGKLFEDCSQLKTLDLSYNVIESVDNNTFFGLSSLSSLDLSGNRLTELNVQLLPGLTHLNLKWNALKSLSPTLVNWPTVKSFDLSGNVWECNCEMKWMLEAQLDKESLTTLTCSSPFLLRGKRLTDLTSSQLSCSLAVQYRRQASIGLVLAVTVLFVALSLTLVVKYRHTLMPCFFNPANKYETLYSATEAAFDAEEAIQIIKASPADYKAAAAAAAKGDKSQTEPTAV